MSVVEWAADLPQGAFSNYENRGAIIEAGEHRAITLPQLLSLATLLKQVIGGGVVYDPQLGAALDAIVSDDLEKFKLAMLTIHSSEQIWETHEAVKDSLAR